MSEKQDKGEITERIARMIENDANGAIGRTLRVAQSDVAALLGEFMEVTSLDMTTAKSGDGYTLTINVGVSRFYDVGNIT